MGWRIVGVRSEANRDTVSQGIKLQSTGPLSNSMCHNQPIQPLLPQQHGSC